jgi:hypothetical protein
MPIRSASSSGRAGTKRELDPGPSITLRSRRDVVPIKPEGRAFHAISGQARAYSAVPADRGRKFPSSICAKSRRPLPDWPPRKRCQRPVRMVENPKLWRGSRRLPHPMRPRLSDGGLQNLAGSLGRPSLTGFERNELSDQMFELAWQRLRHGRQIVGVQLTTDCG